MKTKTTIKRIKTTEENIIRVGYCDLWYLLKDVEPSYYTSGVYGWNADVYTFGGCAIVTGYRPFGNILVSHELIQLYNHTAKKIWENYNLSYDEQKRMIEELRNEFISKAIGRYGKC